QGLRRLVKVLRLRQFREFLGFVLSQRDGLVVAIVFFHLRAHFLDRGNVLGNNLGQLDNRFSLRNGDGRADFVQAKLERQVLKRVGFTEVGNRLVVFEQRRLLGLQSRLADDVVKLLWV